MGEEMGEARWPRSRCGVASRGEMSEAMQGEGGGREWRGMTTCGIASRGEMIEAVQGEGCKRRDGEGHNHLRHRLEQQPKEVEGRAGVGRHA